MARTMSLVTVSSFVSGNSCTRRPVSPRNEAPRWASAGRSPALPPTSPELITRPRTSWPVSTSLARVAPQASSRSSGCAPTASTFRRSTTVVAGIRRSAMTKPKTPVATRVATAIASQTRVTGMIVAHHRLSTSSTAYTATMAWRSDLAPAMNRLCRV